MTCNFCCQPGSKLFKLIILLFAWALMQDCHVVENPLDDSTEHSIIDPFGYIDNLKRGDILVKPNLNWLNGTELANNGISFGHAAIVLEDNYSTNTTELLGNTFIFESVARRLAPEHQNRKALAIHLSNKPLENKQSFLYEGARYRLRPDLPESEIDAVIKYILNQDNGTHSWRATKLFDKNKDRHLLKTYCSLLIWQAYYDVLDMDMDCNQGCFVYPNDIIRHPFFDGEVGGEKARIRF